MYRKNTTRAVLAGAVLVALALSSLGCEEDCVPRRAIVADIDETLTTLDLEFIFQISDPSHDPEMRPDANTLMTAYADAGYGVFYVTARGEEVALADGTSARDATRDWLLAHGFPFEEDRLFLYPGLLGDDEETVAYKAGVVTDLIGEGWTVDYAYGNADTDVQAYLGAGVPADRIFLVGRLAGTMGVEPIADEDAYTNHLDDFFPTVDAASCD